MHRVFANLSFVRSTTVNQKLRVSKECPGLRVSKECPGSCAYGRGAE